MRLKTVVFVLLIVVSLSLFSQEGTRAAIQGKSGENWILDKGTADGVALGLKGYFWTSKKSGDKWYSLKIARFQVVKVEDKSCQVKVEEASEGFSETEYQWAAFIDPLQAAKVTTPTPEPKARAEKPADSANDFEPLFWESIKDSKNINDFREYLAKYPEGTFAGLANNRIRSLEASSQAESEAAVASASGDQLQPQTGVGAKPGVTPNGQIKKIEPIVMKGLTPVKNFLWELEPLFRYRAELVASEEGLSMKTQDYYFKASWNEIKGLDFSKKMVTVELTNGQVKKFAVVEPIPRTPFVAAQNMFKLDHRAEEKGRKIMQIWNDNRY